MKYDIKDESLAEKGKVRTEWAGRNMPVLKKIGKRFEKEKPLEGLRLGGCLHVTTETANLMIALKKGGAQIALCASNPLSTQDDVAAHLVENHNIPVFAKKGEDSKTYYEHINSVLDHEPHVTMDDGADLVSELHKSRKDLLDSVIGGTEETTTGVIRLRSMTEDGALKYPVIAVNDAKTKHLFDNRYGTGQSTIDGILRATNILLAGMEFVVAGYGWCGRGVAKKAEGMGANVIICEVDPLRALEAKMDGFRVMPMKEAASIGKVFVTLTGDKKVIDREAFEKMNDNAIVANAGHFNVEIDLESLKSMAEEINDIREYVTEYRLEDGRRINVLGDGRLINLAAAEGHPAQVMDMSFANQALSAEYHYQEGETLNEKVYPVPRDIDEEIASLKLETMGVEIDTLTEEQKEYLSSWDEGTS